MQGFCERHSSMPLSNDTWNDRIMGEQERDISRRGRERKRNFFLFRFHRKNNGRNTNFTTELLLVMEGPKLALKTTLIFGASSVILQFNMTMTPKTNTSLRENLEPSIMRTRTGPGTSRPTPLQSIPTPTPKRSTTLPSMDFANQLTARRVLRAISSSTSQAGYGFPTLKFTQVNIWWTKKP